jgi:hypothetical protein
MNSRRYLPSTQFTLIAFSLFFSAGLVYAADRLTHPKPATSLAVNAAANTGANPDWQASLAAVQENSGVSLPDAPDQTTIQGLLQAAKNGNLTDSISRSLFVNLMNAKGQGLGSDIPTQEQLISGAISQIDAIAPKKIYAVGDLIVTDSSKAAMRAYGNATMDIFIKNSDNEFAKTLVIMDAATTGSDASKLELLAPIQKKYTRIEQKLAAVPVPKILLPFHLELVNDYAKMAATYDGMQTLLSDPLAGLAALQQYHSLTRHAGQMFINIAQALNKNDILFNTDEPGNTWSLLLQAQQQ